MTSFEPQTGEREQIELVWRRRADRLAQKRDTSAGPQDLLQVLVFYVGAEQYGLELTHVASVIPPVCCTPVPGAPATLAGIIDVQGEIRPVLDFRRMLGLAASAGEPSGETSPVIIFQRKGRRLGLLVDRVETIRSIPRSDLRAAGASQTSLSTRYLESLTPDTLMLLSVDALFAEIPKEGKMA